MRTIFIFEWKRLSRNLVNVFLLFFFLVSGLYSVFYGTGVIRKQQAVIDSVQTAFNHKIKFSIRKFDADTTTRQGKAAYESVGDPSSVSYLIKPPAIFFPNTFSILATGQRDVLPFYKEISAEKHFIQPYEPDIANPEILAEGSFDLSFVLIYLLPLFMIALNFNVFAQEKEEGTLLLLHSQCSHTERLLFYKLLFRTLVLSLLTINICIVAIYRSSHLIPLNFTDLSNWFLVTGAYLLFWFAVCYLVVSFNKNSVVTAFYLSGCWLLLTIILPFLLNFYIDVTHPPGIRADMASQQRKIEEAVWDIKPKDLIWNFYTRHPDYKTGNLADTLQYSPRRFAAYYDELERRLSPIAGIYNARLKERNALMTSLADFVPTLKMQKMLNQIGKSDLKSFERFDKSSRIYQRKWQAFIYNFIFNDRKLQKNDYRRFPKFTNPPASDHETLLSGTLQLLLATFLLIALRFYIAKKFKQINH